MMYQILVLLPLGFAAAQHVGREQAETHPVLEWKRCQADSTCETVTGEVTVDSNWRWVHRKAGFVSCIEWSTWTDELYDVEDPNPGLTYAEECAIEGADYERSYGVATKNDTLSQRYRTNVDFSTNYNSRLFLLESKHKYQMFTLLDNELAFDVDLSTVDCGLNSALHFVAMDPDGGMAKYPSNRAGAEYGTGYCDATCSRSARFVGGRANVEGWTPSATDEVNGEGLLGACCSQIGVWNSNANSYSTSAHVCREDEYYVCEGADDCNGEYLETDLRIKRAHCDRWGCDYNPHRLGVPDFYGKEKLVDTTRKFTVVTRFQKDYISQFFIQDNKTIYPPVPAFEGFPGRSDLDSEYCESLFKVFGDDDYYSELGGFSRVNEILTQPMVLAVSISDDHWAHNLWLDSVYPPEREGMPGANRGECNMNDGDPSVVHATGGRAEVVWSNIRFGPIGSTVQA